MPQLQKRQTMSYSIIEVIKNNA